MRDTVAETLRRFVTGCQVTAVETLAEGRAAVQARSYDLIILDDHLPDGRGFEWIRDATVAWPPLVLISGDDLSEQVTGLKNRLPRLVFWQKPFRPRGLAKDIRGLLGLPAEV